VPGFWKTTNARTAGRRTRMYMRTRIIPFNGRDVECIETAAGSLFTYQHFRYWILIGGEWQRINGQSVHKKIRDVLLRA
jgi:hypothetical protein